MLNRINNNVNFNGGFLINYKLAPQGTQETLENNIGNGKQIFRDWDGDKNSVFYITRDSKDYNIAKFIEKNNLDFKYYPELNTKLRFDPEKRFILLDYLEKNNLKIMDKIDDLIKFLTENRKISKKAKKIKQDPFKPILEKMGIQIEGKTIKSPNGITTIKEKNTSREVIISPLSEHEVRYVRVVPEKPHWETKYYMIDADGNILKEFKTPDAIIAFRKGFNRAVEYSNSLG